MQAVQDAVNGGSEIFGQDVSRLDALGGGVTAREIAQQPQVWPQIDALVAGQRGQVDAFLAPLLARPELRIVMAGAGTSAFIGECLAPGLLRQGRRVEAVPTTDLVSGPDRYFQRAVPTLVVSFARSGSSPESVAAVALADQLVDEVHHLVITCNEEGQLYRMTQDRANALAILLPDATHDRGFAMTTSFTSMLLAAALAFRVLTPGVAARLAPAAGQVGARALPLLTQLVDGAFRRVVYLGSNELRGLAREAALKLLELTDGQVVAIHDSPLGFRHGPKTIVDDQTLVVVLLSNDPQARRYDLDLLRELRGDRRAGRVLALGARQDDALGDAFGEDAFVFSGADDAQDLELALPYIVFCQSFAYLRSLSLGVRPDTPSMSGTVNRVVRGVTIYPFDREVSDVPRS
ncbi:SIS domain-containing protein [Massilia sp. HP4]|uniref:SIS domain-containing protein n=1 Tax=Massilia sp. HP4 TaxID=2562316 RepID=UPI0010C1490C|nr:SIS domain-containing protein [Massilia sp. HP4]